VMAEQGVSIFTVGSVLGHADPSTTARTYARIRVDALRGPLEAASAAMTIKGNAHHMETDDEIACPS